MRYCPFCGTKLEDGQQCTCKDAQEAASQQAAAAQGTLTAAMYQKIMMAFGALQVLFFFILS